MFPKIGADLSKRVSFRTDYKYVVWENYVIIYKIEKECVEIYRVINRFQDMTRIIDKRQYLLSNIGKTDLIDK